MDAEHAAARAELYAVFARLFSGPADGQDLETLLAAELGPLRSAASSSSGLDVDAALATALATPRPRLDAEFHGLFVVPGGRYCAPLASVQLERGAVGRGRDGKGLLWGATAQAIRAAYAEAGLVWQHDSTLLPDHLATMLTFLVTCCGDEAAAYDGGDSERAATVRRVELDFIERFLAPLTAALRTRVQAAAATRVYPALLALLGELLALDGADG